jgi:hypothetical protein
VKKSAIVTLAILVVVAIVAYKLLWTAVQPKIEHHRASQAGLMENEKAANGPLPGDVSLFQKELECCQGRPTPGYFSSLNGAENADSERSSFFPCASFLGSWDGPNKVFAWRSEDGYEGCSYINNRRPGELYIVDCPVENANFKHMTIAPDGTLIMKDQTRPNGSKLQGTMAIIKGIQEGLKEQVTWHDAHTGRRLAEPDFFEPLVINSLVTPGFGGRCYFPTHKGFITLQVMPANTK